jgi:hypothetical protein
MNLTPADADEIRNLFGFSVTYVGRYESMLCRIEAVVPWNGMGNENFREWFNKLEIYKLKSKDLNAKDDEAGIRIIAGTARNMGIEVVG